ncbi:S-methyl-5-thioribose-1-phosphate isomerase [Desulfopila inferna]|uniref:S-methyl-5-thioribose-1-phosphate isomerase n=1 Tax=Desulfopila inferna TaxID=468528 RepID=UPI0019639179|nr:S-methyl-5-thioribose-1-phosphate isomerase [Desulfopila inferna]MBM9605168.1 S-methyl-5-thioribose-1-phosphate isomerase [Desulfopila inferna]
MNVNGKSYRTIWPAVHSSDTICIIDQRQLPHNFVIEELTNLEMAWRAIRDMHVRGAGLIGATAGFAMHLAALEAQEKTFTADLEAAGKYLNDSRPTARNLGWAVDRILQAAAGVDTVPEKRRIIYATACRIADEDAGFCRKVGEHGRAILKKISARKNGDPVNILTHCNAGWLAFVDYGSATAPIYAARDAGINVHVWVDETRPWNQGAKLTAWELQQEGIPNTLITDNAGGHLMQTGKVDVVIVGTDRTTHTGDVANKIGTYLKALAAKDNNIPFYVALPSSTFDWNLDNGRDIPIEIRSGEEITRVSGVTDAGTSESVWIAGRDTIAENYAFDITPARLVTGLITERGIVEANRESIHALFDDMQRQGDHHDISPPI